MDEDGTLPLMAGEVVRQGEDLGRWVRAQRLGFDKLSSVQQWMCEHVLGIAPAAEKEKPKARVSQAEKWAMHYTAARQYYEREGHLTVPGSTSRPSSSATTARNGGRCHSNSVRGSATNAPARRHSPPSKSDSSPRSG
ncbi:helicase associated domain-containing protein [Streptomyces sp. bgisy126]|uniref:helicase associated domain-containing protein n=1 Tax=unclassified Streptomyces TaxID=2593676 RepID=UPI003EBE4A8D